MPMAEGDTGKRMDMMAEMDPSYQLLACQHLRTKLGALVKEVWGIRENKDIEPVHQARVASRRMRAGLRMFAGCFDGQKIGLWRKRIRRLTKGLGLARDLDVQIEFLESFLCGLDQSDKRSRPGIKRLMLRLRQRREAIQPRVVKALDALDKGNVMAEMHGELEKELFLLRQRTVSLRSPYVLAQAAEHIRTCQCNVFAHEHTLADPQDTAGHHQLRIEAKRLRYTMEICDPVYEGRLGPAIKAVKRVQTLLGDIHDCDVWVEDVQAFIEVERQRTVEYFGHARPFHRLRPGLVKLVEERTSHREQTFTELVTYWKRLEQDRLWEDLEGLLDMQVETTPGPGTEGQDRSSDATNEKADTDSPH